MIHELANAGLYYLTYTYSDPNYSKLNHWGVIQALALWKGVYVAEPSDVALTETTLIHTSPLWMVAVRFYKTLYLVKFTTLYCFIQSVLMAAMEGIMSLLVKVVVSAKKVVTAIQRFTELVPIQTPPKEPEVALLLWIANACQALKLRIATVCKLVYIL